MIYSEQELTKASELRELQDEFIKLVEKKGAIDSDLVIDDFERTTLGDLKRCVYPQYEGIFREYIEDY